MNELSIVDKNFNEKYSIPEFKNIRKDLLVLISKVIIFLFKTSLIKDVKLTIRVLGLV